MSVPAGTIHSILDASLSIRRIRRATDILSKATQWRMLIVTLAASDILMTAAAFGLAFWLRFGLSLPVFQLEVTPSLAYYQTLATLFTPLWLGIFIFSGLYNRRNLLGGTQEYALVFRATTMSMMAVIVIGFLEPEFILARGWLLLAWFLSFFLVSSSRFLLRRVVYALRKRGYFVANTIIVGSNDEGFSLAEQLLSSHRSGLYVLGFVDETCQAGVRSYRRLFNLGHTDDLEQLIERHQIEEIILVTSALPREKIIAIFKKFGMRENLSLRLSSGLYEVVTTGLEMGNVLNVPLVRVSKVRQAGIDRVLKLLLDYAVAIPVLFFMAPMLLLIALLIRLDSPGPAIYRRRVMGKNGRIFDAYKFRTMHINGNEILDAYPELKEELERTHKLKEDPRITRIGRIMRQYSLDELPQLLNVLKREMSIVGPRMITPEEMKLYDKWDMNLLTVNPGLTGLWQVSGRSNTTYEQRVRLDMRYIRTWTIWTDIYIIWLTVPAVLKKDGAY